MKEKRLLFLLPGGSMAPEDEQVSESSHSLCTQGDVGDMVGS